MRFRYTLPPAGTAAVMVTGAADATIWIDLGVHNTAEGRTGLFATGELKDGRFALAMRDGSTLKGELAGGSLRADWEDVREGGGR